MANELVEQKKQKIAGYLSSDAVKANIMSVVGEKDAQMFISSVVSAVQTNPQLADCTNASILSAALLGHSLKLPHSPQLGYYWMVPYNNTKEINGKKVEVKEATFQIGWKGYYQLAMRSGQYKKIHVTDIKEGELKRYDPIEDEYEFEPITDLAEREKKPTIGYYGFFILTNGLKQAIYWSKERMENHARKYSVSYRKGWSSSIWKSDFDGMAKKTIIRQLVGKYGVMSVDMVDMQTAYKADMSVIDENGNPDYVDNIPDEPEKAVDVYAEAVDVTPEKTEEKAE